MTMAINWLDDVLDLEGQTIAATAYTDERLYDLEQARVFRKSWLFLAHESQLPNSGDFFRTFMGEDQVIVARQKDGSIAAFLNQCRHRGARLCRADAGKAQAFMCSYHGWTYGLDGALKAVPNEETNYPKGFDKSKLGARRVPRLANFHGLIFGCWDENAPDFEASLGHFLPYAEANFARGGETEVVGGVHKWRIATNWKLPAEQFVSDIYHFATTHFSAVRAHMLEGAGPPPGGGMTGRQARSAEGHGGGFGTDTAFADGFSFLTLGPEATGYLAGPHRQKAVEALGQYFGAECLGIHMTLFPNLSYLPTNQTLRVWHPRGPGEIEVWAWTLVDKEAPAPIKEQLRKTTLRTFGTSGMFEQDDSENWTEIMRALKGAEARQTRFHLGLGLGQSTDPDGKAPGKTDDLLSEAAARAFYGRWAQMLADGPAPQGWSSV